MYNQTMPLVNFSRESGWNPIEAWLMGASPVISGSTGIDNLAHTVSAFQQAHQSPKFCADKTGKVVPCDSPDRVQGGATGGNNNPISGGNPTKDNPYGDQIPGSSGTPKYGNDGIFDEWFKRIMLALVAIIIIAIAVVSLR